MANSSSPLRLNPALVAAAERSAAIQKRSVPKQIEYWAELGKALERVIQPPDVYAILQGLKKLTIEPVVSNAVAPEVVFDDLEQSRGQDTASAALTASPVYYEASVQRPGMLDRVETATGRRLTGRFENGAFKAVA